MQGSQYEKNEYTCHSDASGIKIEDIIDIKELKSMLNWFVLATGLGAIFVNPEGSLLLFRMNTRGSVPFVSDTFRRRVKRCNQL